MLTACTVVARNYLPYARVLAASLEEQHDDVHLVVLVLDGEADPSDRFEVVRPTDLDLTSTARTEMTSIYGAKELATAFKPALLRTLLRQRAQSSVVFLDPDILVTAPLDDLWAISTTEQITLVPHALAPWPEDGRTPTDLPIRRSGIYNGGFLGVGATAGPFLDWWDGRLRHHAIFDKFEGLFVDQRWLDFVPAFFPHRILRDRTIDVAYWNLHERDLTREGTTYLVDGLPLRFFHFSGFDPLRPQLVTRVADRFVAAGDAALEPLCAEYARRLLEAGYLDSIGVPFESTASGDATERRLKREESLVASRGGDPASASARVRAYLASGASPAAVPSRSSAPVRRLRRLVARTIEPVADQQALVDRTLLELIEERETDLRAELAALSARIASLERSK